MKRILKKLTDSAIVGIVTAILLIGLIVLVISIVQIVYVPIIMEQREAEHMDRVAEQFSFLTSVIDNQAADGRKGIPIATFVTLGSKELGFLASSKAFGSLAVVENSSTIKIQNDSIVNTFPIGTITYSSDNAYYLDQSYTYEAGAMIVSQYQGNKMIVRPYFFVDYNKASNIVDITFEVVNISSIGLKTIAAGYGICGIQTEFNDISTDIIFTNISNITIATSFRYGWFGFINRTLCEAGLNSAVNPSQFILTDTGQAIKLDFLSSSNLTVNIIFKIIEIRAQVGPGWIE
jgi:hypothetical protein